MMICCSECKYWNSLGSGDGICRRHAPRSCPERLNKHDDRMENYTDWPRTFDSDWCGEAVENNEVNACALTP